MRTVVIRCDGTIEGGLGHLVRGVSVASAARAAGWSVLIAGDVTSPFGRRLLDEASLPVVAVPESPEEYVTRYGARVVHVDDYIEDDHALQAVRAHGALLSSMEDGPFGRRAADIAIDSTLDAEVVSRPADGSRVLLRGIDFAPMRDEVLRARALRAKVSADPGEGGARILVVLGGSDATGSAADVAAVCARADGARSVTVIAPAGRWDAIRAAAGNRIRLLEPSSGFMTLAAHADLVVSSASTIAWELACIGVPAVVVPIVDNQTLGYRALTHRGVARGIGTIGDLRDDPGRAVRRLESHLSDLLSGHGWAGEGLLVVDGRGAHRIVNSWEMLAAAS